MSVPAKPFSRHFGSRQLAAIDRIGDWLIPGDAEFPTFSATGCVGQVDRLLDYMPEGDRKDLGLLLTILSLLPGFALGPVLALIERSAEIPDWAAGGVLRLIRLGLRGIVMSLYYGGRPIHERIGFGVSVYLDDQK